jgi:glyoxylase-like metal-dependent hydrolase (beta-lactamase superfamily II)
MANHSNELVEVANNVFVYLQPDGGWGLSNAGLVVSDNDKALVDTFFDLAHTNELLAQMRRVTQFDPVATVVINTHANGDHCYGNALLADRRIIASERAREELLEMPAAKLHRLMKLAAVIQKLGPGRKVMGSLLRALGLRIGADLMDAVPYVLKCFGDFDFSRIPLVPPNVTFSKSFDVNLGSRKLTLLELGPAHTEGDVIAFESETRTLFAGDLLFMGCHPLAWAGTPASCIASLERLLELNPVVVVPGHGPLTDRSGIEEHLAYYRALRDECRPLYDSGMSSEEAARLLLRKGFGERALPERLAVNVDAAYREFSPERAPTPVISAMGAMARLAGMA